jgi:2-dehydro-3-deoxyphosphogluconate aldolase / (4S)-4-hydroxy-2-oxoglutarate aldolase
MNDIKKTILKNRIIAIIRGDFRESILTIVGTLLANQITIIEVTLNSPQALAMIQDIAYEYGNIVHLGAGTVTSPEEVRKVAEAGGKFIVSPDTHPPVIQAARLRNLEPIPGALTPTEVLQAKRAGATFIKLFPASQMGPTFIKQLRGPIADLHYVPTGGITIENAASYLQAGAAALGIGSTLVPKNFDGSPSALTQLTERAQAFYQITQRSYTMLL